ncbi:MAG: type II toxin-antitoxin system Phd/YefM family antitoxin [Caldilinea sp. CFX5]|nr:type II toxin-antitoxin system Phd/YefM family antitoxin [Caldilinea sp. CFX5]
MSTVYTYSKARQNFAALLDRAAQEGEVRIKRRDGRMFVILPERQDRSPLDMEGITLAFTREEIIQFVHEGRRYSE